MKLGILQSFQHFHKLYMAACNELGVAYELIDIMAPNWLETVRASDCAGFLCRPDYKIQERKTMYDERLYIMTHFLGRRMYPSYDELFLYENKRMCAYWLEMQGFPRAETRIFYRKKDYFDYLQQAPFPLIFKSNIGAGAKGVMVVRSNAFAKLVGHLTFGFGNPHLTPGYPTVFTGNYLKFPSISAMQRHFLYVQKFEKIKWEWKIVRIDDAYFGHRKLLRGDFASGTHLKAWGQPPDELLFLVKDICDRGRFWSMGVDILETTDGRFLVNELHSLFGQPLPYLMLVDNKPGRLVLKEDHFVFEEGNFTAHESYLQRVQHFLKILQIPPAPTMLS